MILEKINRIAVLKLRNIGDTLLATPALRNLRIAFPQAHITIFVGEGSEEMLTHNTAINEIIIVKRTKVFFPLSHKSYNGFIPYYKMILGSFDLVLDYTTGDRATLLTILSRAKCRAAYKTLSAEKSYWKSKVYTDFIAPPPFPTHEVVRHLHLLESIGIPTKPLPLELTPSSDAILWADNQIRSDSKSIKIHFHPVSRWLFKCWDDTSAGGLIQKLHDSINTDIYITSSNDPKEIARINNILSTVKCPVNNLAGKTTLEQTAAISQLADIFIGVDTAPMHMAAAVGTPVVCLFGPSGVETWSPWGDSVKIIHHPCHCNISRNQTCKHDSVRDCLKSITIDEVYQNVIDLLLQTKPNKLLLK